MSVIDSDRRPNVMEGIKWVVAPEQTLPKKIEIPSLVVADLHRGIAKLKEEVSSQKPDVLVFFRRSATLLEKAIQKHFLQPPFLEVDVSREFTVRYKNRMIEEDPHFLDEGSDKLIARNKDNYISWLRKDRQAISAANRLAWEAWSKGTGVPRKVLGIDDFAYTEETREFTWPIIAKMAFGEGVQSASIIIFKMEWLREILVFNFEVERDSAEELFLRLLAKGEFDDGRKIQGETEIWEVGELVKKCDEKYAEAQPAAVFLARFGVNFLVSLKERIEDSLEEVA